MNLLLQITNFSRLNCSISCSASHLLFFLTCTCLSCLAKKLLYLLLASPHELKRSNPTATLLTTPLLMIKSLTLSRAAIASCLVEDPWISKNLLFIEKLHSGLAFLCDKENISRASFHNLKYFVFSET